MRATLKASETSAEVATSAAAAPPRSSSRRAAPRADQVQRERQQHQAQAEVEVGAVPVGACEAEHERGPAGEQRAVGGPAPGSERHGGVGGQPPRQLRQPRATSAMATRTQREEQAPWPRTAAATAGAGRTVTAGRPGGERVARALIIARGLRECAGMIGTRAIVAAAAVPAGRFGSSRPCWPSRRSSFLPSQIDFAELPQQPSSRRPRWASRCGHLSRRELRDRLLRRGVRSLDLALVSFIACSLVSLALAPERQAGVRVLAHWAACGVAYLAVSRLSTIGDVRWLARGALLGAAAVACVGLGQAVFHFSGVPQAAGPSGTMANRDLAAAYLVAVAPLAMLAGRRRRWPVSWPWLC